MGFSFRHIVSRWIPVERHVSPYTTLEVIRQKGKLVLNAPHVNYSFGSLHQVFRSAFQQLNPDYSRLKSVLILGFGAGSVAHILQQENRCPCHITGIEMDADVLMLAKKYFGLGRLKNLELHTVDAEVFLTAETQRYDLIVVDLFLDHRIPEKFLTSAFLEKLHARLQPQGTVMFNYLLYDHEAKQKAVAFEKEFRNAFQQFRPLIFKQYPKNIVYTGKREPRR